MELVAALVRAKVTGFKVGGERAKRHAPINRLARLGKDLVIQVAAGEGEQRFGPLAKALEQHHCHAIGLFAG